MKTLLITGATAGIGEATAKLFAKNKYKIIITGRRKELLLKLKQSLEKDYNTQVYPLHFDVRKRAEVENAINSLPTDWKNIDILVNNAGLALGLSTFQDGNIDDWDTMIDTNVKGLLYVTKAVLPFMPKNSESQIINIGSIAGKEVYPKGNIYCSTKHAVDALTRAMRIDLLETGIKITAVHPGMVETEFSLVRYKGDKEKAKKVYENLSPLTAADVAETIFWACNRPSHVNISDIVITPTIQANATNISRK